MESYDNDAFLLLLDDDNFWKEDDHDVQPVFQPEYASRAASNPG